jgi:hypothetical protein
MFAAPTISNQEDREYVKVRDLVGHLLILKPIEVKQGIKTVHGDKEVIILHLVDLSVTGDDGQPGKAWAFQSFIQGGLIGSLKQQIGQMVLAVMGTEPSGKGNPKYVLINAADNPQYTQFAAQWMSTHPDPWGELNAPAPQSAPIVPTMPTVPAMAPAAAPMPAAPMVPQAQPVAAAPMVAAAAPMAAVPAPAAPAALDASVLAQLTPEQQRQLMAALQPAA